MPKRTLTALTTPATDVYKATSKSVVGKRLFTTKTIANYAMATAAVALFGTMILAAPAVHAQDVRWSVTIGSPAQVVYPQPRVVYPSPQVIYQPSQVIYQPSQVIYQVPQVVYPSPQVIYQPPQVIYQPPQVIYRQPQVVYPPIRYSQPYPVQQVIYAPPGHWKKPWKHYDKHHGHGHGHGHDRDYGY